MRVLGEHLFVRVDSHLVGGIADDRFDVIAAQFVHVGCEGPLAHTPVLAGAFAVALLAGAAGAMRACPLLVTPVILFRLLAEVLRGGAKVYADVMRAFVIILLRAVAVSGETSHRHAILGAEAEGAATHALHRILDEISPLRNHLDPRHGV